MNVLESEKYFHNEIIKVINHDDLPEGHKDDLYGAAIMMLLKREKIKKLSILQAKAQTMYDNWCAQNPENPEFTWTILFEPSPSKEFLDNKGNNEKLNFTFILIPEWWHDNDYYEHFPFVKNALKLSDSRFIDIIHTFHVKRFITQVLRTFRQPIDFSRPDVLEKMQLARDTAMEKIKLAIDPDFPEFTLKPVIVDSPDHQRDVRVTVSSLFHQNWAGGLNGIIVKPGDSDQILHDNEVQLRSFCAHLPPDKKKEFMEVARAMFDPPATPFSWDGLLRRSHFLPYNYKDPTKVFLTRPLMDRVKIPITLNSNGRRLAIELDEDGKKQIVFLLKKSIAYPIKNWQLQLARNSFVKWFEIVRERQIQQQAEQQAQLVAATISVPKSDLQRAKERRAKKSGKKSPTNEQLEFGVGPKTDSVESRKAAQKLVLDEVAAEVAADVAAQKKKTKKKKKKKKKSKSQSPPTTEFGDPSEIASTDDVETDLKDDLKVSAAQEKKEMYDLKKSIFRGIEHNNNLKIWNFLLVHLQKLMKENLLDSFVIISGGMATFLHTKGTYPTEDLDLKVYPKNERISSWNYQEVAQQIFEMVQKFLQKNQRVLLEDLKNHLNMNNVIQISALLVRGDTIKISFQTEQLIEASPEKPVTVRGTFYASNTTIKNWVAYCDIGIWKPWNKDQRIESEKNFLKDALDRNFYKEKDENDGRMKEILKKFEPKNIHDVVIEKLQKDGKEWYSFGGRHTPPNSFTYNGVTTIFPIVSPDYLLYEKTELVRDIDEKSYYYNNHELVWDQKVDKWKTQIKLLDKAVKKGGKRKTRRRRKKRKSRRRKKRRRTRRKSRRR